MKNIKVGVGDTIRTGQKIATLGTLVGAGSGSHVHIGVTKGNPLHKNMLSTSGWYDVTKMHGSHISKKAKKATSGLTKLVTKQLKNSGILGWIKKHLAPLWDKLFGDSSSGTSAKATGSHLHWLEQAGIPKSWYPDIIKVINRESHWDPKIANSRTGAYGIPQALPGTKMASSGSDWRSNPITQLRWMKGYIKGRYGNAKNAWSHETNVGWYSKGGLVTQAQLAHLAEQNKPEMILPLTNKSRTVQLAREALEMVAGNDVKASASTESTREIKTQNKELIKQNKTIISLLKSLVTASQNPVQAIVSGT